MNQKRPRILSQKYRRLTPDPSLCFTAPCVRPTDPIQEETHARTNAFDGMHRSFETACWCRVDSRHVTAQSFPQSASRTGACLAPSVPCCFMTGRCGAVINPQITARGENSALTHSGPGLVATRKSERTSAKQLESQ